MKKLSYNKRIEKLVKDHGHKLNVPAAFLDSEDKSSFGGGLRCFKQVYFRDDHGNKKIDQPKHRCNNPAVKGSFFCQKHGGKNAYNLIHGNRSLNNHTYKLAFNNDLSSLFDKFLNDQSILDLKPELAALRTILSEYLNKITGNSDPKSHKLMLKEIDNIRNDDTLSPSEKFLRIYQFCISNIGLNIETITQILKLVKGIQECIVAINKMQNKDEFILTPDGIKILFRSISSILTEHLDVEKLKLVKQEMLSISVRTQGDLSKLDNVPEDIASLIKSKKIEGKTE